MSDTHPGASKPRAPVASPGDDFASPMVDAAMPHRTLLYARSEASPAAARLVVVPVLTAERKSVRLAFVF